MAVKSASTTISVFEVPSGTWARFGPFPSPSTSQARCSGFTFFGLMKVRKYVSFTRGAGRPGIWNTLIPTWLHFLLFSESHGSSSLNWLYTGPCSMYGRMWTRQDSSGLPSLS